MFTLPYQEVLLNLIVDSPVRVGGQHICVAAAVLISTVTM